MTHKVFQLDGISHHFPQTMINLSFSQDIDECQVGKECEGQNKFCVNTEGSFKCMACDKVTPTILFK